MSATLDRTTGIVGHTLIDLVTGTFVSTFVDAMFGYVQITDQSSIKVPIITMTQAVLTMLVAIELRDHIYDPETVDPTGGLMFIVTVFRQPNFWRRLDMSVKYLTSIFGTWIASEQTAVTGTPVSTAADAPPKK